jgi:hypothetical protein
LGELDDGLADREVDDPFLDGCAILLQRDPGRAGLRRGDGGPYGERLAFVGGAGAVDSGDGGVGTIGAGHGVDVEVDAVVLEAAGFQRGVAVGGPAVGDEHHPSAGVGRQEGARQPESPGQIGAGGVDLDGGV